MLFRKIKIFTLIRKEDRKSIFFIVIDIFAFERTDLSIDIIDGFTVLLII